MVSLVTTVSGANTNRRTAKLHIELNMAELIAKIVKSANPINQASSDFPQQLPNGARYGHTVTVMSHSRQATGNEQNPTEFDPHRLHDYQVPGTRQPPSIFPKGGARPRQDNWSSEEDRGVHSPTCAEL
jgi:hypothetical protein